MVRFASLSLVLLLAACAVPMPDPAAPPEAARSVAPGEDAPMAEEEKAEAVQAPAPAEPEATKPKARKAAAAPPPPPPPSDLDRQPIEELVIRPESVTGFWRLVASRTIDLDVGIFSGVHIRYGGEIRDRNICWLQQKGHSLDAFCASAYVLKNAEGSVDDDGLTMRWWMGAANIIFSGKFADADKISGGFSGGVVGLSVTGDVPATLVRLPNPAPGGPERPSADLMRMVWEDVRKGALTEGRYEGSAVKRVNQGLSKEMAAETPQQMTYLGEILIRWRKEQRETLQDVYLVQTDAGRRLCRVAPNQQGQVIDFSCGKLPD